MLVMTATPIPRTLVLTYFGDMDVSELREKPAGRQPIDTRTIPLDAARRGRRGGRPRARRGPARLLGLPAGRGIREQSISPPPRSASTSCKQHFGDKVDLVHGRMKGADKDARHGALRRRRDAAPGRHHRDRGRRRRAGGDRHGDRARRALRPRAAAPAARPHRPRHRRARPACCSTRRRSARPPRRGSPSCARPRTASASPRRTCGCAAKATCSARARAACRASASRASRCTASCSAPARDDAALMLARDPDLAVAARRGAAPPALSVRARRGDPADPGGLTSTSPRVGSCARRCAALRACAASAASFFCASPSGCTMPADMISVIALSTVMSSSMMSLRGT